MASTSMGRFPYISQLRAVGWCTDDGGSRLDGIVRAHGLEEIRMPTGCEKNDLHWKGCMDLRHVCVRVPKVLAQEGDVGFVNGDASHCAFLVKDGDGLPPRVSFDAICRDESNVGPTQMYAILARLIGAEGDTHLLELLLKVKDEDAEG